MRVLLLTAVLSAFLYASAAEKPVFYFFHSVVCPHCVEAEPFIAELEKKYPQVEFRKLEVYKDLVNRELLKKKAQELGVEKLGVPFFVIGKQYISGFKKGDFEAKITAMIDAHLGDAPKKSDTEKPVAKPSPIVLLQEESRRIGAALDGCYVEPPSKVAPCLRMVHKRFDDFVILLSGIVASAFDRVNKNEKSPVLPTKEVYLNQQLLLKKTREFDASTEEALCRLAKTMNCEGLGTYRSILVMQERVQKLLADLDAVEKLYPVN